MVDENDDDNSTDGRVKEKTSTSGSSSGSEKSDENHLKEKEKKTGNGEEEEPVNVWEEIDYGTVVNRRKKGHKKVKRVFIVKTFGIRKRKKRVYKCLEEGCEDEIFECIKDRTEHVKVKHGLKEMVCEICGAKCTTDHGLRSICSVMRR